MEVYQFPPPLMFVSLQLVITLEDALPIVIQSCCRSCVLEVVPELEDQENIFPVQLIQENLNAIPVPPPYAVTGQCVI